MRCSWLVVAGLIGCGSRRDASGPPPPAPVAAAPRTDPAHAPALAPAPDAAPLDAAVASAPDHAGGRRLHLWDLTTRPDGDDIEISYTLEDHGLRYGRSVFTSVLRDDELAAIDEVVAQSALATTRELHLGGTARTVGITFELGGTSGEISVEGDDAQLASDPLVGRIERVQAALHHALAIPHAGPPPPGPVVVSLAVPGEGESGRIDWRGPFPAISTDGTLVATLDFSSDCPAGVECWRERVLLTRVDSGHVIEVPLYTFPVGGSWDDFDVPHLQPLVDAANRRLARYRLVPLEIEDLAADAFATEEKLARRGPGLYLRYQGERLTVIEDGRPILERTVSLATPCRHGGCVDYCGDGVEFLRDAYADRARRVLVVVIDNTHVPSPDHCSAHEPRSFVFRLPRR